MYTGARDSGGASILAIRLGAMGDILHTLPAAATLKHSFPGARLVWAVEPRWSPLLEDNPYVDELLLVRRSSLAGLALSLRELRARRFSFAVDFQGLIKSAAVAALARVDRIHGYHQDHAREKLAALIYSNRHRVSATHMVDRHLELAAAAGASNVIRTFPLPQGKAEAPLPDTPFVLASPLAGWRSKQWPLEHYAALAELLRPLGLTLVLDVPRGAALPEAPGVWLHSSSLAGLIHATRRAAAVIGVDSGPLHLAAALRKPGVAIFGPTDPARNGPYGDTLSVLRSPAAHTTYKRESEIDPAMTAIKPGAVLEALRSRTP